MQTLVPPAPTTALDYTQDLQRRNRELATELTSALSAICDRDIEVEKLKCALKDSTDELEDIRNGYENQINELTTNIKSLQAFWRFSQQKRIPKKLKRRLAEINYIVTLDHAGLEELRKNVAENVKAVHDLLEKLYQKVDQHSTTLSNIQPLHCPPPSV